MCSVAGEVGSGEFNAAEMRKGCDGKFVGTEFLKQRTYDSVRKAHVAALELVVDTASELVGETGVVAVVGMAVVGMAGVGTVLVIVVGTAAVG